MRLLAVLLLLPLLLPARTAAAAESGAVSTSHGQATLVTDADGWVANRPLSVGLHLRLAPGWHTYWINPGDAGEAPQLSVDATGGATGKAGPITWPTPEALPEGPLMSYGYTGDVLLPASLTPVAAAQPGQPVILKASADWLSCSTVCVPDHADFTVSLPAAADAPASAEAALFARARAATPVPSPFTARISPAGLFTLSGAGLSPVSVAGAAVFPLVTGAIDQVAPQVAQVRPGLVTVPLKPGSAFDPKARFDAVVVLRDPKGTQSALSVEATPGIATPATGGTDVAATGAPPSVATTGAPPSVATTDAPLSVATTDAPLSAAPSSVATTDGPPSATRPVGLAELLLFALLGGLVLNLMPCVFPVLAMKAVSLARLSGLQRREQRLSALFYTAGILLAFGGLGGAMLALRAAGSSIPWGFQFQSLAVVAGTGWLLFAVGLNLLGTFEVGGRLMGAGQGLAARGGHLGDFATGLLAVLVATPCTAPFMGVALAGAFAAPPLVGLAVFLVLGLGLALPYLLVACVPRLAALLPRPGLWMEILKQAMAFPMFAAVAWLVWVASRSGGSTGVLAMAAGLVLLGTAGWLLGLGQRLSAAGGPGMRGPRVAGVLALALLLAALALLPGLARLQPGAEAAANENGWERFSETRLAALRRSGRPVLVDMSAAWCVSCLVNERLAFHSGVVTHAFAAHDVALLKGDWTRYDAGITRFLRAHGRDGVPFYIYYPPGRDGTVWPQILTPDFVAHAIDG